VLLQKNYISQAKLGVVLFQQFEFDKKRITPTKTFTPKRYKEYGSYVIASIVPIG